MNRAVLLLLVAACDTYDPRPNRVDAGPPTSVAPVAPNRWEIEAKARAIIAAWTDAQNLHDAEGLATLYAPGADVGPRRTLVASQPLITIGLPTFKHVQDTLVASFIERRKWPSHAEHGRATLVFDAKLLIAKEEPIALLPGTDEEEPVIADGTALPGELTARFAWVDHGLELRVTDRKGVHVRATLQRVMDHPDEAIAPARADAGAWLYETRVSGPAGTTDLYRVRRDGDFLVVGHGVEPAEIVRVDAAKIQLSPGAKVVVR